MSGHNTTKLDFWQRHIEAWKASNLTRRQYCDKNGVSCASLSYWQWKMRGVGIEKAKLNKALLVPIRVEEKKPVEVSLWIGDDVSMVFPSTVDPAWVASVIDCARMTRP